MSHAPTATVPARPSSRNPLARWFGAPAPAAPAPPSIILRENFLSPAELSQIRAALPALTTWDSRASGYWQSRIAHADALHDAKLRDLLVEIRRRVRQAIVSSYNLTRPLHADTLQLVRWPEGFEQAPHADAENPDGSPHPYSWRAFASIIYLNDDFAGGQIHFPNQGIAPPIRPGMLAFFPGTLEFLHGVRRVTRGTRYTLASFWTFDPSRRDRLPL